MINFSAKFLKTFFNKQIIGLDIGASSVKAVQVTKENGTISLNKTGYSKLTSMDKDRGISLKQSIRDIWREQNFETNKVGISLSGKKVIARYIELPYMETKELKKALPFEIQTSIPYPLEDVMLTSQVVDEFEKNGKKNIRVLYAVSLKKEVDKIISLLTALKLEAAFIDLDMISLERAYRLNSSREEDILMVDIGADTTNFNFLHNGSTLFARDIEWGGNILTGSLRKNLKISSKEAEEIKKKRELIAVDAGGKTEPNSHIIEHLNRLSKEINLVIRHCMFNSQIGMPEIIYISGGGALLKNLDTYLAQSLEIPVKIFNPFEKTGQINYAGDGENSQIHPTVFTMALGLALRSE
ncbi:MAG: type IV pilus assembly protein PilM [Elusimicrobia bacterium]|nr:type IV pilus assembly protein PilM [Elusimicrobiota bacterium]